MFIGAFDISGEQALIIAVIGMLATIIPMIGYVLKMTITQMGMLKDAWTVAMSNKETLRDTVLPQLQNMQVESTKAHSDILGAINDHGAGTGTT